MATAIAVYNSEGCVGRCDARCHDAVHDDCGCICGGMNHGKSRAEVVANTERMAREWCERAGADYVELLGGERAPAAQGGLLDGTV